MGGAVNLEQDGYSSRGNIQPSSQRISDIPPYMAFVVGRTSGADVHCFLDAWDPQKCMLPGTQTHTSGKSVPHNIRCKVVDVSRSVLRPQK